MGAIHGHHGMLLPGGGGGGGGGSSYNALVTAATPLLWYKHNELDGSGTAVADSSGNGYNATAISSFTNVTTVAAASGYAGLGSGMKSNRATMNSNAAAVALGSSSSSAWTIVTWLTGGSGSTYVLSRDNDIAVLAGYVANKVELFSASVDTRTGSQMNLTQADTTTPHMVVYRYNNGTYSGFLDGANVFSVARSLALPVSVQKWTSGGNSGGNTHQGSIFDAQIYSRALSDLEISNLYAARNVT